jgi:hypothetical protein
MKRILLSLLLSSCAATPAPPPLIPPVAIEMPILMPVDPAPVASVVRAYRAAERKEVPRVTADGVTADYVRRVHIADLAARHALAALERQDGRATPEGLARARTAVSDLAAALNATP